MASLSISAVIALTLLAGVMFGLGYLVGWSVGILQEGRRRVADVKWWAELHSPPSAEDKATEVVKPSDEDGDPELVALRRAEVDQVFHGLKEAARREGRSISDADLRDEAVELVSRVWVESASDL